MKRHNFASTKLLIDAETEVRFRIGGHTIITEKVKALTVIMNKINLTHQFLEPSVNWTPRPLIHLL